MYNKLGNPALEYDIMEILQMFCTVTAQPPRESRARVIALLVDHEIACNLEQGMPHEKAVIEARKLIAKECDTSFSAVKSAHVRNRASKPQKLG